MIDAHAHLDFAAFDDDRSEVMARARGAGVTTCIVPGVEPSQWARAAALGLPCCAGLHPQWLREQSVAEIESALGRAPGIVGIGECGLDARARASAPRQREIFEAHLRVAKARDLPVVLHVVRRHGAALDMLGEHAPVRGMVHGFSGSPEVARAYVSLGLHVSFGGVITRPGATKTRAATRAVPIERLLVETDAPDMSPVGSERERNEPALLPRIIGVLAELRGEDVSVIAKHTAANARTLFRLAEN